MKHVAVHRVCAIFQKNNILQGSVATSFRCDGKFDDSVVANFLQSERILKIDHTSGEVL